MVLAQRYEVLEEIGRGGMGCVYRAYDRLEARPVAVKALLPEAVREPDLVARLVREAEALRELDHPGIVRLLDFVTHEGAHYLVLELMEGGSLRRRLESGPLAQSEIQDIFLDLADALTRAHRLGIVHRDLKPDNVLFTSEGRPRLADFGLAHLSAAPPLTAHGTLLGTVAYLSPEAILGGVPGPAQDIWSMGVMLFECFSGRLPFEGNDPWEQMQAVLSEAPADLQQLCPAIPDALAELIDRMLEKDAAARPSSLRQVAAELEKPGSRARRVAEPAPETPRLPVALSPWLGATELLERLRGLLLQGRVLTLLGPGGIGKTRLAQELAGSLTDAFDARIFWVSLASRAPEDFVAAVADALALSFSGQLSPLEQVRAALQSEPTLLVLDNLEHLLVCAPEIARLASAGPRAHLLLTSRQPLGMAGEVVHRVQELTRPEAEQVFLNAVRRVQPGFSLASDRQACLARICSQLGGFPLCLELVATWVPHLSLEEIESELAGSLLALDRDVADLEGRVRSMRAVFQSSWELLGEEARAALARLTVFRGRWTREAAREVAGVSLPTLRQLLDASMARRLPDGGYHLHELVRQLAGEHLVGREALLRAHAVYYCALLDRLQARMRSLEVPLEESLGELELELENVALAWRTALEQGGWSWLAGGWYGLLTYCDLRGRHAYLEEVFLGPARARAREEGRWDPIAARLELASAVNFSRLGRAEEASQGLERAGSLLENGDRAYLLAQQALMRQARRRHDAEALEFALQAIPSLEEANFRTGLSVALVVAAIGTWVVRERPDEARELFRRAIGQVRGNPHPVTRLTLHWLRFLVARGELADVPEQARAALEKAEQIQDPYYATYARVVLGQALVRSGETEAGASLLRQALSDSRRRRYLDLARSALESLAEVEPEVLSDPS